MKIAFTLALLAQAALLTRAAETPAAPAPVETAPLAPLTDHLLPVKAPAVPLNPPPLTPRMRLVRERIEVLFRHRSEPAPTADPRLDPFRPAGPIADLPNPVVVTGQPPVQNRSRDLVLLQEGAATLKISGIFEFLGRQHLVVNSRPYKENDVIQVQAQGQTIYLRVRQISRTTLTLVLNEAELVLKY